MHVAIIYSRGEYELYGGPKSFATTNKFDNWFQLRFGMPILKVAALAEAYIVFGVKCTSRLSFFLPSVCLFM